MGYDLFGADGVDMMINSSTYTTLLDRGRLFVWIPMGTSRGRSLEEQAYGVVPDDTSIEFATAIEGETSRGYWANDGNAVCAADASNLATALRAYRTALTRIATITASIHADDAHDLTKSIGRILGDMGARGTSGDNEAHDVTEELRRLLDPIRKQHPWLYHLSDVMLASLIGDATPTWMAQVDAMIAMCENGGFAIH